MMNPSSQQFKGPQNGNATTNKEKNVPTATLQNNNKSSLKKEEGAKGIKNLERTDSQISNCEHDETIFNEDFFNTEQLKYFIQHSIDNNNTNPYNSNVLIQRDKHKIFDTGTVVQRYSQLSSVLENRKNPLLSNKGKMHRDAFQNLQKHYESSSGKDDNNESQQSSEGSRENSSSSQDEEGGESSENEEPADGGAIQNEQVRESRRERVSRAQLASQKKQATKYGAESIIKEGQQSMQQGFECDQMVRSGPSSRKGSSHSSKNEENDSPQQNIQQSNRSKKQSKQFKEDQFDDDNCSDTPAQRVKLNKDESEFPDENNNEESSIENVLMDAIKRKGVNKQDEKGGGSGASNNNRSGHQKKKGKGSKVEKQASLQKSGSKEKIKGSKQTGKSKFQPKTAKDKYQANSPMMAESNGQSPSNLVKVGFGLINQGFNGISSLNPSVDNKAKQAVNNTLNQMNNPFMKSAFSKASPQPGPNTQTQTQPQEQLINQAITDKDKNDKLKKLNLNQGMISNKPILNIDGVKNKAIRMPSHSSNNSQESKERNDMQSQRSFNSSNGALKSCFRSEDRRSSRKFMLSKNNLDSQRVRFHESVGKYSEDEESNKHYSNREKYKKFPQQNKNGDQSKNAQQQPPDVKIMINMRRFMKEVNIKGTHPLVSQPYFKYYLLDQVEKKKYYQDVDICKYYTITQKRGMLLLPKQVATMQKQFTRKEKPTPQPVNFRDISQIKNAIKTSVKKTIVFDMDNTIMTTMYKKNEIQEYDAATYVKLFGHSALKIYLNYRPYLKEMLSELKKNDFELMLFSFHNAKYLQEVAATLQKDEAYFDFLINKEHLYFDRDLDLHILDLNILLGTGRDLKDIIVISNSTCRHLIQYSNGVPVKEYTGSKRDLSLFALTKYLKQFKEVKDVRTKIAEDFGIQ